jgi:hypothetical protein
MNIVISGRCLGTLHNLIHDGDRFIWSNETPDESWLFGFDGSHRDLELIAEACGYDLDTFDRSPHGRSARVIFGDSDVIIPWMHMMPKSVFQNQLQNLLKQLWRIIDDQSNQYYMNQFLCNRELLMTLQQPLIDVRLLRKIADKAELKRGELLKFMPAAGDVSPRTVYNQIGSITGRLTVKEGPNILTLKRENRRIFKSRFKGGKIIQIDISSLEPRIALSVSGKDFSGDIYEFVGREVLENRLTRDQVKIAVLSCMYGASSWSLSKQIPEELDSKKIMNEIKSYFEIPKLKLKLENDLVKLGYIRNVYGRNIKSQDSAVNHFLQSSGVDVSFNVFSQILDDIRNNCDRAIPIYVIHDAILLDVAAEEYEKIKKLTSDGYKVDKLDCIFPVKVEIIRE